jgi:hypothetical protein
MHFVFELVFELAFEFVEAFELEFAKCGGHVISPLRLELPSPVDHPRTPR